MPARVWRTWGEVANGLAMRLWRRNSLRVAAAAVVATAGFVAIAETAEAFPEPTGCYRSILTYVFDASVGASDQTKITNGFEQWEDPQEYDGTKVISVNESTAGDEITVSIEDLGGEVLASTNCTDLPYTIKFDDGLDTNLLEVIAAHELGHAIGLNHSGRYDSFQSDQSIESICYYASNEFSQDDHGAVTRLHGPLVPRTIQANSGFEEGSSIFWGKSSVSSWSVNGAAKRDGSFGLEWTPSSSGGYIYQTMNWADPQSGTAFDARTNRRRKSSGTTTGSMTLWVLSRRVEYGTAYSQDCEYGQFTGGASVNQNFDFDRSFGWVTRQQKAFVPTTTYKAETTSGSYDPSSSYEGVDLRVKVSSTVKIGGSFATIYTDTTRVREL